MAAKPLCCTFPSNSNSHPLTLLKIGAVGPAQQAGGSLEVANEESVGGFLALWLKESQGSA